MADDISALGHRIRWKVVGRYIGQLLLVLAILLLVPLGASLIFGDTIHTAHLVFVISFLALAGFSSLRLSRTEMIQINEALVVTTAAFLCGAASLAYVLSAESKLSTVDAIFEGISAITTTGLSTLTTVEDQSRTFLFTRAWGQWFGGLGIVVLSVALLLGHNTAARRLAVTASRETDLQTTARTHAQRMLVVYSVLTAIGLAGALILMGTNTSAVAHVLSAVSTGGFSTFDDSLAGISGWPARFWLTGIAMLCALPLPLYFRLYRNGLRALLDPEATALFGAMALVIILLLTLAPGVGPGATVLLGISAQTTTGFSASNVSTLPDSAKLILVMAMAVGGSVGSTAGGIKLLRVILLLKLFQLFLRRTAIPAHAVLTPRLAGHAVESDDFGRAALMFFLFVVTVVVSWLIFVAAGYSATDSLFEVVSATGTVGLSTGITGPDLSPPLKLVLCADMFLGRLEMVAVLILAYPRTWIGKPSE